MVVKKVRTAKQKAATKKLVAFNKARRKNPVTGRNPIKKKRVTRKRVTRKRVGTSQTAKSMTTKKRPTRRLKKRRASNTRKGYYPNPTVKLYIAYVIVDGKKYYFGLSPTTGKPFLDSDKKRASIQQSKTGAVSLAINAIKKEYGKLDQTIKGEEYIPKK